MILKTCIRIFLIILLSSLFIACDSPNNKHLLGERSFCYWNTYYTLDTALWNKTEANHSYIRYFDVDWDVVSEEAKPIASVQGNDSFPANFTPSVFLTNKVFEKSDEKALDSLSVRIRRRLEDITNSFGYNAYYKSERNYDSSVNTDSIRNAFLEEYQNRYKEILIDCDWTAGTKDKFFYFIKQLKKDCKSKNITATLRLWQYKQTKTAGVPPVDRCLLMCYNMQTANDYNVENSIASIQELKKYVSGEKYPLRNKK